MFSRQSVTPVDGVETCNVMGSQIWRLTSKPLNLYFGLELDRQAIYIVSERDQLERERERDRERSGWVGFLGSDTYTPKIHGTGHSLSHTCEAHHLWVAHAYERGVDGSMYFGCVSIISGVFLIVGGWVGFVMAIAVQLPRPIRRRCLWIEVSGG